MRPQNRLAKVWPGRMERKILSEVNLHVEQNGNHVLHSILNNSGFYRDSRFGVNLCKMFGVNSFDVAY